MITTEEPLVVSIMNLSEINTRIGMNLALWINKYYQISTSFYTDDESYSKQRQDELIIAPGIKHEVPIYTIANFQDFNNTLSGDQSDVKVCQIDYGTNLAYYLSKSTHLICLVEKVSDFQKVFELKDRIRNLMFIGEDKLDIIVVYLVERQVFLNKETPCYNIKRDPFATHYKWIVNQKALGLLTSKIIKY